MTAHWIMLIWIILISQYVTKPVSSTELGTDIQYKTTKGGVIATFLMVVIICGLRTTACDTEGYVRHFNGLPITSSGIKAYFETHTKAKGFYYFSYFVKKYLSDDYHVWLMIIALISVICIAVVFYKYSYNFKVSAFLLITTCYYSWLINGMRQFLVICILFALTKYLTSSKKWHILIYLAAVLLLRSFHSSAIIMLAIAIAVRGKAWNKKTLFLILFIIGCASVFGGVYEDVVDEVGYTSDTAFYASISGTNIFRVAVGCIPALLALIKRKECIKIATPMSNLLINMSLVTAGLYILSAFKNGMLEGRLPAYAEIYSLLLIPYLCETVYKKNKKLIYTFMYIGYFAFFFYQMSIKWGGLGYSSDILTFLN